MSLNLPEISQEQRGLAKLSNAPTGKMSSELVNEMHDAGVLRDALRGALLSRGGRHPTFKLHQRSRPYMVFSEWSCSMQGCLLFIKSETFLARVRNQERIYKFALG